MLAGEFYKEIFSFINELKENCESEEELEELNKIENNMKTHKVFYYKEQDSNSSPWTWLSSSLGVPGSLLASSELERESLFGGHWMLRPDYNHYFSGSPYGSGLYVPSQHISADLEDRNNRTIYTESFKDRVLGIFRGKTNEK